MNNYQTITTLLKNIISKENLEKLSDFYNKHSDKLEIIREKSEQILDGLDTIADGINSASEAIKNKTDILCKMHQCEKLDKETLKSIIIANKVEKSKFVALLNTGRNKQDVLHIFLQYLDGNKEAIDVDTVHCIRCEMIESSLKDAFGNKELLVINL